MEYKASFDTLTKTISLIVAIVFAFVAINSVTILCNANKSSVILLHIFILLSLIATMLVCYLYSTDKYYIGSTELIIKRPIGEREILISDITEIRLVEEDELNGLIRTFGSGGLFGYFGKFYNSRFGFITLYTTQLKNRVFIRTKSGKKIIISPDDVSIVDKLKALLSIDKTI